MLSRPCRDQFRCFDMLAAKACSPGSDSILLPRGAHAFAAGMARATSSFTEGRESMAPPGIPKVTRSVTLPPPLFISASKGLAPGLMCLRLLLEIAVRRRRGTVR